MSKETKPKSLKEWLAATFVENIIQNVIEIVILSGIFFLLVGHATNHDALTACVFFLMYIPVATSVLPGEVIKNSRRAFLHGKWEVKEGEDIGEAGEFVTLWRRFLPEALIAGFGTALLLCGFLKLRGADSFSPLATVGIAFIVTCILTTIVLKRHLTKDFAYITSALAVPKQEQPEPFKRYFFWEYALPWTLILLILNTGIGYKNFTEMTLRLETLPPAEEVAIAVAFTAAIISIWMWFCAQNQVRPHVHLGRVRPGEGKTFSVLTMTILLILMSALMGVVVGVVLSIAGLEHLQIWQAIVVNVLVGGVAGIIGCAVGVSWGGKRELSSSSHEKS